MKEEEKKDKKPASKPENEQQTVTAERQKTAEAEKQTVADEKTAEHLKEALRAAAREEEKPRSYKMSLASILGGDILSAQMLRSQIWLMLLIAFILIIYVASRYSCQRDMIEMDRLQKELVHAKFRALSSSSDLTEKCRESKILQKLKENNDSLIGISDEPPYIISADE